VRGVGAGRLVRARRGCSGADGLVAAVQDVALPVADEHALRGAALVARILVDRPPALRGPAHDFDRARIAIVDESTVAAQVVVGGVDDGHAHAAHALGNRGIEVVRRWGHGATGPIDVSG
jgi:hypothetical protein